MSMLTMRHAIERHRDALARCVAGATLFMTAVSRRRPDGDAYDHRRCVNRRGAADAGHAS